MKNIEKDADQKKGITREQKTKLLIVAASVCVVSGVAGIGFAKANSSENRKSALIKRFSEKFNLSENDVEDVFIQHREETREQRRAEMRKIHEERLSNAVSAGKITAEQKNLILDKIDEVQGKRDEMKKEGREFREERRAEMDKYKEELKAWASDNGIDDSFIGFGIGREMHGGHGRGMHK